MGKLQKIQYAALLAATAIQLFGQPRMQEQINQKDGLTYVRIPAGAFLMGCSANDTECAPEEKPAHQITIATAFFIGQTPVTEEAYQQVTGKTPSYFKNPNFPVESITWQEAQTYCEATGMRLPTESEWEYAARAGTTTARYAELNNIAWTGLNSNGKVHEVMQKRPNAWNLYDMLGNVWQWTADWYIPNRIRALRGGSWGNGPSFVRASVRSGNEPDNRSNIVGFRCVGEAIPR